MVSKYAKPIQQHFQVAKATLSMYYKLVRIFKYLCKQDRSCIFRLASYPGHREGERQPGTYCILYAHVLSTPNKHWGLTSNMTVYFCISLQYNYMSVNYSMSSPKDVTTSWTFQRWEALFILA